jgi:hypothetical protein
LWAFVLLLCRPAYAYIDPGTGSALVYVATGIIVSAYFAIRGLYYAILDLVLRRRFKGAKCFVVLHSEDVRYETTFLPLLRALAERNIETAYLTMYKRDDSFEHLPVGTIHRAIPPGLVGYAYLNHLEAKVLVTTTPQLDVMTFRRSKRVRHYAHVPHALGECRFVRPFAYDFFDSVMCCGPLLKENIRRIEVIHRLPAKVLFETGIPHYDELLHQAKATPAPGRTRTVLVAPSWGPLSLFSRFGTGFVRALSQRYATIVRPHPQMRISQPALLQEILAMEGVVIDTKASPADARASADILVSDISGIVHEFAFIHQKPALVVDHETGTDGFEGFFLRDVVSLKDKCAEFVVTLSPAEIASLPDRVDNTLERHSMTRVVEARGELIYNFGAAATTAARQIEEVLQSL